MDSAPIPCNSIPIGIPGVFHLCYNESRDRKEYKKTRRILL